MAPNDIPDTARGKRIEARALRGEAIRMLRRADVLDQLAEEQAAKEVTD